MDLPNMRRTLAINPRTPGRILEELCSDKDLWRELSDNKALPSVGAAVILDGLEQTPTPEQGTQKAKFLRTNQLRVLNCLAGNPNCDAMALQKIFDLGDLWTKERVISNPNYPVELFIEVFALGKVRLQLAVVRNPRITKAMLAQFVRQELLRDSVISAIRKRLRCGLSL
jgi:hypothetical protein